MQLYSGYLPWVLGCLVISIIVRKVHNYLEAQAFARKNGTKPAKKLPQWEQWLGIQNVLEMLQAAKGHGMLDLGVRRYAALGKTFETKALGRSFTHTIDPENIKTVLSTNFKDYGVGQRIDTLGPLLGSGIFTTDGAAWEHSRVSSPQCFLGVGCLIGGHWGSRDLDPSCLSATCHARTPSLYPPPLPPSLSSATKADEKWCTHRRAVCRRVADVPYIPALLSGFVSEL